MPVLEKIVAAFIGENGIVQVDFGEARNGAQNGA
jgi:hypothetical protein